MSQGSGSGSLSGSQQRKSAAERSPVAVGDLVADKYRVESIIAAGGMGVVVAARHVQLDQRYAIKFLLPDTDHTRKTERFLREARAAARVESPHVCRVFDCGTLPNGTPYMVMEHLSGQDLGQELRKRGRLPVSEAVDLLLQAIEGVAEAHAAGIVHRDLKPTNLFLHAKPGRPRAVKVVDFGISKLVATEESAEDDLTATATMLGSPRYMSPEQVQSAKRVDARTDIWSLGVILYQLLDGKSPFAGSTMGETIGKILLEAPAPIREARNDVPEGVAAAIDRCLQRDRDNRYRNVAELAVALAPFGSAASQGNAQRVTALLASGQLGLPEAIVVPPAIELPTIGLARSPADEPSIGTVGGFSNGGPRPRPRRRGRWVALAVLGVAAIGVGVFVLMKIGTGAPNPAAATLATETAHVTEPQPPPVAPLPPASTAGAPSPAPAPSADSPSASPSASASPTASVTRKKPAPGPGKPARAKSTDELLKDSY